MLRLRGKRVGRDALDALERSASLRLLSTLIVTRRTYLDLRDGRHGPILRTGK